MLEASSLQEKPVFQVLGELFVWVLLQTPRGQDFTPDENPGKESHFGLCIKGLGWCKMKAKSLFTGPEDDSLQHRHHIKQHRFTPDVCALLSFDGCPSLFMNNSQLQEEMDCEFSSASDETGFLLSSWRLDFFLPLLDTQI